MTRLLRVLLAFSVGALCIVGVTPAATAADGSSGTNSSFTSDDKWFEIGGLEIATSCTGNARWRQVNVVSLGSPEWVMEWNAGCWRAGGLSNSVTMGRYIQVLGRTDDGDACVRKADVTNIGKRGTDTWVEQGRVELGKDSDESSIWATGVCNPTRITVSTDNTGPDLFNGKWSAPVSLGPRPTPSTGGGSTDPGTPSSCPLGTPSAISRYGYNDQLDEYGNLIRQKHTAYSVTWAGTNSSAALMGGRRAYLYGPGVIQSLVGTLTLAATNHTFSDLANYPYQPVPKALQYAVEGQTNDRSVVGFQIRPLAGTTVGGKTIASTPTTAYPPSPPNLGTSVVNYPLGSTIPEYCIFWVGPKIITDNNPATTWDDPFSDWRDTPSMPVPDAPLPTPSDPTAPPVKDPPKPDERCDFKITDPTTWAGGGMCALVGLLSGLWGTMKSVLTAVVGLPVMIAKAIGDMLSSVFVPDGAVMTGHTTKITRSWGSSGPGEYMTAFGAVAGAAKIPETGGCEGPSYDFDIPKVGKSVRVAPLDSCGSMERVASVTKIGLMVLLLMGTAIAALRMVGSSIGLNLNGVGRDD